jgi:hypothetical protein
MVHLAGYVKKTNTLHSARVSQGPRLELLRSDFALNVKSSSLTTREEIFCSHSSLLVIASEFLSTFM